MDLMRISGIEPLSFLLSQTKYRERHAMPKSWRQKGRVMHQ